MTDAYLDQRYLPLDSVVAWRVLYLTMLGREVPQMPCNVLLETMSGRRSLIEEWSVQMREYESLKSGRATLALHSLRELPATLVKARIAAGLTQKELAERLGLKP